MDQVRVIFQLLLRERFWVLSVVGTIVAVVCWYVSSGDLDQQFNSREQAISLAFNKMNNLYREPVHPNDDVNQGDLAQLVEQRKIVLEVWKELYDRQREEVLYWPKESLKADFIKEIEKLEFGDPFPVRAAEDMLSHYRNYIETRFDGLLEIAKARKTEERGGRSRFGGGSQSDDDDDDEGGGGFRASMNVEEQEQDYLVQWIDQNELRAKLQFMSKPTPRLIWVTQEDLWVYETLLNVIAKTNQERGATRPDNTAVRVIVSLQVGRAAAAASRQRAVILMPNTAATQRDVYEGEEDYDDDEGRYDDDEYDDGGYGDGEGMGGRDPLASRYLDAEGRPYGGEPEDAEFRRLPVRMLLKMDQRWIPQLLIECANAALPIEVTQLRLNPDQSGAGFGSTANRSFMGGSRVLRGMDSLEADANLADVEIRGIVYIYNKPDETVLEVPGIDADQFADVFTDSLQR